MDKAVVGINYEGGKITEYAQRSDFCVGYINAQIAMDAPFHDQVADESVRSQGRSELSMAGYDEANLIRSLSVVVAKVADVVIKGGRSRDILTIIQVARGRSAADTIRMLLPIIEKHNLRRYHIVTGYKSFDYFTHPQEPFVLLNIGMFGRLSHVDEIKPGDILSPSYSYDLQSAQTSDKHGIALSHSSPRHHTEKNVWNTNSDNISTATEGRDCSSLLSGKTFILLGIDDSMPFVTPEAYDKDQVFGLVDTVLKACIDSDIIL